MTIVLTGGGSGGHVTPVLAVAAEIKKKHPETKIIYIGQKGDRFADIPTLDPNIDQSYEIRAGKFRRFHGEGAKQLLDLPVLIKNIRDFFYVLTGILQSRSLMKEIKPDVIFSRGGYVSVPVCIGGKLNKIPYITHDSDPIPSLANRIIARWASAHAVALPKDVYPYPANKTITTGIPLNDKFIPIDKELKNRYRQDLGIPSKARMLFVIGGGLGSQAVNNAVTDVVPHLMREFDDLYVIHGAGGQNEAAVSSRYMEELDPEEKGRVKVCGFINDVYKYSGAADIIITRAGATNLAEFAIQGKACIVIPSAFLTGGHQLKSAEYLTELNAAVVINDAELVDDPNRLAKILSNLLRHPEKQEALSKEMAKLGKAGAAETIADLIYSIGE